MKKSLLIFLLISCISISAQDYKPWAIEIETGMHAVGDESAWLTDNYNHFGATLRYNFNPKVGLGFTYGRDNLSLLPWDNSQFINTDYNRYDLELFVDIFDILDLQNNFFTILGHGGGGLSTIDAKESNYYQNVMNMRGGATALFNVSKSFSIKIDASTTVHMSQDKTLDGIVNINNAGINSTVDNLSMGIVFYPGKKDKKHADWVVEKTIIPYSPIINNNYFNEKFITEVDNYACESEFLEYVFFEHDKTVILQSELNAITKAVSYLSENPDEVIVIRGFASATSSSDLYNMDLSSKRSDIVYNKMIAAGVKRSQLEIEFFGKDLDWSDEIIHDMSRRVELKIKK